MPGNITKSLSNRSLDEINPEEVLECFNDGKNAPLKIGNYMYLIAHNWADQLKKWAELSGENPNAYATTAPLYSPATNGIPGLTKYGSPNSTVSILENGTPSSRPGPIDNRLLVDETTGQMKADLQDESDYVMVDEYHWQKFVSWFGLKGPELRRLVIQAGNINYPMVEIYPPKFTVFVHGEPELNEFEICCSKSQTVGSLKSLIIKQINPDLPPATVRLWSGFDRNTMEKREDLIQTIGESTLSSDRLIMVEKKIGDTWQYEQSIAENSYRSPSFNTGWGSANPTLFGPLPSTSTSHFGYGSVGSAFKQQRPVASDSIPGAWPDLKNRFGAQLRNGIPGVTGLNNLGNTCFMNSALQCLSNTPPLTRYFWTNKYRDEINRDNPLGMGGGVADEYGYLIHQLWSGHTDSFAPRKFKFTGYQQHDSQELAAFLLDGLHEDLNRILKKPYTEVPDYDGSIPDTEYADRLWSIHKSRNDSVIVDLFQGQYKSTLHCPECGKFSITFDPFMYLTLPLPVRKKSLFTFKFIPADPQRAPVKHTILVPGDLNMRQVRDLVSQRLGVDSAKLRIADIFQNKFYKHFTDDDIVKDIRSNDIINIYELEKPSQISSLKRSRSDNGRINAPITTDTSLSAEQQQQQQEQQPEILHYPVVFTTPESIQNPGFSLSTTLYGEPQFIAVPSIVSWSELWEKVLCTFSRLTKMDIHEAIRTIEKESEYDENEDDYARWRRRFMDIALFDDGDQYRSSKPLDVNEQGLIMLPTPGVHSLVAIVPNGFLNILLGAENTRMNEYEVGIIETDSKPATDITLDACFDEFSRKEQLGEEDAWYCPTCKKHQQATKKLDLWRLPEILVVHLKRFSHSRWHRDKIENMVNYPLQNLDLRTRIRSSANEQAVYDLFAVSVHYGGLGGGHYTAYAKNMTNRRWYDFDDSRVTEMNETEVLTKNAYILFYRRKREGDSDDGHLPGDEDTASLVNDEQPEASGNAPALAKEDDMSSDDNSITVHTERDADIARFFSPNEISDDDLPPVYSP